MKIIFLAGGGGTRLWPMSRNMRPKQFETVVGEFPLFTQTVHRVLGEFDLDDLYVATRKEYVASIIAALPGLAQDHLLVEPEKRDTGPAMGAVAAKLFRKFPDEPIAFLPTDHLIKDRDSFIRSLRVAEKLIRKTGKMIDIGVVPTYPNVNLGYTRIGRVLEEIDGVRLLEFKGHTEKPPLEDAIKYLQAEDYLWHASYYMWTPRKFLKAFEQTSPEIFSHLKAISESDDPNIQDQAFRRCEKISFDYAVTEKMDPSDVIILAAPFDWSDVGSWSVVKQKQEQNSGDNVTKGEVLALETQNCLIYGQKEKIVACVGLKNMIVVDTKDALLLCPMDRDQDVKKIVDGIKEMEKEKYL